MTIFTIPAKLNQLYKSPLLTFIAKSKVAELDVAKDADLENFRGVDHVEEHGVLLFSVGLHNPTVLVTFDAGMLGLKSKVFQ